MIEKIRKKMEHRRVRLVISLVFMSVVPVVVLGIIITSLEQYNLKETVKSEIYDELKCAAYGIQAAYDAVGNGDFIQLESGAVIKGTYVVNENYAMIDALVEKSGIYSTVFYGNKRVATSVIDEDGNRIVDTYMNDEIAQVVLEQGEEYQGENILLGGKMYYGYYLPIYSKYGYVTGAIFTGKKSEEVENMLLINMSTMISLSGMMVIVAFAFTMTMAARVIKYVYVLFKDEETMEQIQNANKAKSDFLAHMSHEIRTPINAVLGMDEMILRESKDKTINGYALNIKSAGQTLLGLINDILDFSKIEAGSMEIIPVNYDISSLINDSYNLIAMRAKNKGLDVFINNNENLPKTLYGDETRVRQVFTNLLTNAVKYTRDGSVTLNIDYEPVDNVNIILKLSVTDTGIGIKPEDKDKLFDSFQRVDEEKNKNIEGTGLGLSITKQLTALMDGELTVESEYGKGSTFGLNLKQGIVDLTPMGKFSYESLQAGADNYDYQESFRAPKAKILVVDDAPMNLDVFVGLLKETQINIDRLSSGSECLEITQMIKYDVIFLDHMMPEMDGIETLKRMKEMTDSPNADTPIIVLTANAIVGAKEEYLSYGFTDYLSKPVKGTDLEKMIVKYLPPELIEYENENESIDEEDNSSEVTVEKSEEPTAPVETEKSFLDSIKGLLDTEVGLSYCGTEDLYKEIATSYVTSNTYEDLLKFYDEKDWENYRITIHSVKSSSLYIGAMKMSEDAKALEEALKADNVDYVLENHAERMEEYKKLVDELKSIVE